MRGLFLFILISLTSQVFSQEKKKLDHTVYDSWNSLSNTKQSLKGTIISYEINPLIGDGNLYLKKARDVSFEKVFNRGNNAQISYDESFVVFDISPQADTIRNLKLEEAKKEELPKDSLAIYFIKTDSLVCFPNVKSYQLAEEGEWLAYLSSEDERTPCSKKKKKCKKHKKKNCVLPETSGKSLHVFHPNSGKEKIIHFVTTYELSKNGEQLIYSTSNKGESDTLSLHLLDLKTLETVTLLSNQFTISKITFDEKSEQLLFLNSADTNKQKNFVLSYWKKGMNTATTVVDSNTVGIPKGHTVSGFSNPYFSQNGKRIFIGTNVIVVQDPEDTLLAEEKATVDIWNGNDLRIQPEQLSGLGRDKRKNFRGVYHIASKKFIQIENEDMVGLRVVDRSNGDVGLISTNRPYSRSKSWEYPWKRDVYHVDLTNGEKELLKEGLAFSYNLSPSGKYFIWYDGIDSNWFAKEPHTEDSISLTGNFDALFATDVNGNTFHAFPEGLSGWTIIDNEEFILIDSRYDIWAICPADTTKSFCLTNRIGKKDKIRHLYTRFDHDSTYTTVQNGLIHTIDSKSKREGYQSIRLNGSTSVLTALISSDHAYTYLSKAEQGNQLLFRKMSFAAYPELEVTTMDFNNPKKVSETNPQQSEYNWGTVEMINWKSFEGRELRGLLYKPEDFDSTKSYPMITYFYEKYTDRLHTYYSPKPTASIVYPTEYVSNGYIIFIPDIEYTPGHPAASAYDCIVSGTDYLTKKHAWIDSTRIGLQGQSWGGYQTAQLITMTGKYKAAMAGAPVSNMFSAYGGIRWTSGLSRMFQYEHGQSRIGATIWEKPELYIENSPIFKLDKVQTPLLIMHNDGDGSVPWYQGIELFMGLRRLDQPVWLLNYNGDEHNLMETANRKDLSIRMRQFFDYYLLNSEIPVWMDEGVPAIYKGKNYGLELKKSN